MVRSELVRGRISVTSQTNRLRNLTVMISFSTSTSFWPKIECSFDHSDADENDCDGDDEEPEHE